MDVADRLCRLAWTIQGSTDLMTTEHKFFGRLSHICARLGQGVSVISVSTVNHCPTGSGLIVLDSYSAK